MKDSEVRDTGPGRGPGLNHDTVRRNLHNQRGQVFDALRKLMTPPDPPKRLIGFVTPKDKSKKLKA
jgi:hypothetical protein